MKVYITENIDQAIEGYKIIPILYGKIDLGAVTNNAATEIVAIDAMDSIPLKFFEEFIKHVLQKMRLECKLHLGGTELSALCKDFVNGKVSCEDYNEILFSKRGIYNVNYVLEALRKAGLTIQNVLINGYNYEITAIREKNNN